MNRVTVAATQMACTWDRKQNVDKAEKLVREAAAKGAQIITAAFDMDELEAYRKEVCVFRDRRPSLYSDLLTLEGHPVE